MLLKVSSCEPLVPIKQWIHTSQLDLSDSSSLVADLLYNIIKFNFSGLEDKRAIFTGYESIKRYTIGNEMFLQLAKDGFALPVSMSYGLFLEETDTLELRALPRSEGLHRGCEVLVLRLDSPNELKENIKEWSSKFMNSKASQKQQMLSPETMQKVDLAGRASPRYQANDSWISKKRNAPLSSISQYANMPENYALNTKKSKISNENDTIFKANFQQNKYESLHAKQISASDLSLHQEFVSASIVQQPELNSLLTSQSKNSTPSESDSSSSESSSSVSDSSDLSSTSDSSSGDESSDTARQSSSDTISSNNVSVSVSLNTANEFSFPQGTFKAENEAVESEVAPSSSTPPTVEEISYLHYDEPSQYYFSSPSKLSSETTKVHRGCENTEKPSEEGKNFTTPLSDSVESENTWSNTLRSSGKSHYLGVN